MKTLWRPFQKLWSWIQRENNRGIASLLVICISTVIAGVWGVYVYINGRAQAGHPQTVVSAPGGIAAGRDVHVEYDSARIRKATSRALALLPGEVDYRELASPAFAEKFSGKDVRFRALFIAEWRLVGVYDINNISHVGVMFLDHRYAGTEDADMLVGNTELPPFPLSVPVGLEKEIRALRKGDVILVKGRVLPVKKMPGMDFATIYVQASQITKIDTP